MKLQETLQTWAVQPDFVWIREYAGSGTMSGSMMHDSVRGAGNRISWNATTAQLRQRFNRIYRF